MTTTLPATVPSIDRLRADLVGRVITPDDADYDALRTIVLGGIDPHPPLIIRAANANDVAYVVTLAREHGLELAVRSGGHSGAGHCTTDRGVVLDLRDLDDIELDVASRTAWAGSGLTAGAYTIKAAEHGLATGFGDTGSVGLGGITSGGGIGYLVRKYGMTIDSLLAAEIVTADGQIRLVDATTDPDLFWAVRGGAGNVGVATRFRFQLHEVPSIVGGILVLPATPAVIAGFAAAAEAAPDELSTIANVMPCPPMPFVPEEHHGEVVILAMLAYAGDTEAGQAALAPIRSLATPLADLVRPMGYPEMYPPEDDSYHPTAIARNLFMDTFDEAIAATIVDRLGASDASMRVVQIRVLGGAMARVPADATAFAHRDRRIMVNVAAFYDGPDDRPVRQAWVDELSAALRQGPPAAYVNFLADEGEAGVRAAYPDGTYDRLAAIKARVDPTNLFHRNQNVPPGPVAKERA
jgi:FAD/FMN-containing dehydrogenase